jgi:hypothetical protein
MPLKPGKKNIGANIKELIGTGRPKNQALAIALHEAKVKPKKDKKK